MNEQIVYIYVTAIVSAHSQNCQFLYQLCLVLRSFQIKEFVRISQDKSFTHRAKVQFREFVCHFRTRMSATVIQICENCLFYGACH